MENAKEKSQHYFDAHQRSLLARNGYWKRDYRYALEQISLAGPETLVDIGCGPGGFLCAVHEAFPHVRLYALDLSEGMIDQVKERLGEAVEAAAGDSECMPVADDSFDMVTCNMSIHHYPHPQLAVDEMHRILKPGGALLLNDMDCIAPVRAVANIVFPRLPGGDVKMYKKSEILEMAGKAGFVTLAYRKISPLSFQCVAMK